MTNPTPPQKTVSARPILRKSYNEDFKRDAVKLAESIGATQAAHDLVIDRSLINAARSGPCGISYLVVARMRPAPPQGGRQWRSVIDGPWERRAPARHQGTSSTEKKAEVCCI